MLAASFSVLPQCSYVFNLQFCALITDLNSLNHLLNKMLRCAKREKKCCLNRDPLLQRPQAFPATSLEAPDNACCLLQISLSPETSLLGIPLDRD